MAKTNNFFDNIYSCSRMYDDKEFFSKAVNLSKFPKKRNKKSNKIHVSI